MVLVEDEGSYVNQIELECFHVHVGQLYSVLIKINQDVVDYYILVSPKWLMPQTNNTLLRVVLLHYDNSTT